MTGESRAVREVGEKGGGSIKVTGMKLRRNKDNRKYKRANGKHETKERNMDERTTTPVALAVEISKNAEPESRTGTQKQVTDQRSYNKRLYCKFGKILQRKNVGPPVLENVR